MIHNVLARQLPIAAERVDRRALAAAGIDPDRRPQTLAVGEWLALLRARSGRSAPTCAAGEPARPWTRRDA